MKTKTAPIKLTKDTIPSHATHPGVLLHDEIEYREIKQKDLADAMHIATTMLSELIHGKRNITPSIAMKLEKALDIDAVFWMRLQVKYEIDTIRIKHRAEIERTKLTKNQKRNFSEKALQYA